MGNLGFDAVIGGLKEGKRYTRADWVPGLFIFLVPGSEFKVNREPLLSIFGEGLPVRYRPHIDQAKPDGTIGVWHPRNEDLLADDWLET